MAISNASNQIVKVNLIPGVIPSVLHLSQYDTGAGRPITFSVYDGSQAFTIPSGVSIAFEGTKPDGNGFSFTCSKSGSNALLTNYTNQMTALPGKIMCQLVFTDTSGGRVGSLPVLMVVTPASINGDTVISDSDIEAIIAAQNAYAALNARLDAAIDQMNTTTNKAIDQMNTKANDLQNQYAVTNAKLDTAISATTQDSEVQDIRVKADGATAATAGNAVREQFTESKNNFDQLFKWIALSSEDVVSGYYINANSGYTSESQSYVCSNYIALDEAFDGTAIQLKSTFYQYVGLAFYDSTKRYISGVSGTSLGLTAIATKRIVVLIPNNAKYVRTTLFNSEYSSPSDFEIGFVNLTDLLPIIEDVDVLKSSVSSLEKNEEALIDYQKNVGAKIDFSGTASVANQDVTIGKFKVINGHTYTLTASIASGLTYGVYVYFKSNGTTVTQINLPSGTAYGEKKYIAETDGTVEIMFHPVSSVSTDLYVTVFDQDSVIIHLENICQENIEKIGALSGYTYDLVFEQGAIGGDGKIYNSTTEIRTGLIHLPPSRYNVAVNGKRVYVLFYDKDGNWQSGKNIWAKTSDFVINVAEDSYIRICVNYVDESAITPIEGNIELQNIGIYEEFVDARGDYDTLGDRITAIEERESGGSIPSYFTDEYLSNKLNAICENAVVSSGGVFAFITDVHLEDNTYSSKYLMKHIIDRSPVSFVMFGGDVPTAYSKVSGNEKAETFKAAQEWADWVNYWGSYRVYQMRGNHDYVKDSRSDDAIYYNMPNGGVHQFVSNNFSDVVNESNSEMNYYYFDNDVQKIRYIIIDGHIYNASYPRVVVSWITVEQINWLINVLNNSNGYSIVIMSHEACDSALTGYAPNLAIVQTIAEAYKNRGTVGEVASGANIHADFTNATGELVCILSGHSHRDESHVSNGVLSILTTCDACYNNDPNVTRTKGTITESAFDIFAIDTTNKIIKTVRIGGGSDRAWNYSTSENID